MKQNTMEERKKIYRRICNRKLALPCLALLIILIAVLLFTQTWSQSTFTKLLPLYGVIVIALNLNGIKKDKKHLEELGGISSEETQEVDVAVKKFRKTVIIITATLMAIVLVVVYFAESRNNQGGDGVTTCRNCGRDTELVAGFGYCYDCYEGFVDWQEDNWKKD